MTQGKVFGKLIPDSIFPWMRCRSFLLYLAWDLTENASTRPYTIRCFSVIHPINNTCNFGYNITNHMQNYLSRHNCLWFDMIWYVQYYWKFSTKLLKLLYTSYLICYSWFSCTWAHSVSKLPEWMDFPEGWKYVKYSFGWSRNVCPGKTFLKGIFSRHVPKVVNYKKRKPLIRCSLLSGNKKLNIFLLGNPVETSWYDYHSLLWYKICNGTIPSFPEALSLSEKLWCDLIGSSTMGLKKKNKKKTTISINLPETLPYSLEE